MDANGLDAVVLPAAADVGPADADTNEASATLAWRNGTWVANGNLVWRHFGIPTVTVPMGTMADIGMPVGLTFAGKAYGDEGLLRMAGDYERSSQRRTRPPRTPALPGEAFARRPVRPGGGDAAAFAITLAAETLVSGERDEIIIMLDLPDEAADSEGIRVQVHVNGQAVEMQRAGARLTGRALVPAAEHRRIHSAWRGSYGSIVTAVVRLEDGRSAGAYVVTGGIG